VLKRDVKLQPTNVTLASRKLSHREDFSLALPWKLLNSLSFAFPDTSRYRVSGHPFSPDGRSFHTFYTAGAEEQKLLHSF